ncbi:o-succinylbenzoate synthase [Salimicrobium flavidum]|uniref:o-succinylbenzoate synthase n=1 Tax=Salimicrobium flavidum TaxID=570947 RepID=A0A1N7J3W7_9BACI|nr:o-succinylbenzoate synthase [Salimicrobium flavidum]SIS44043.1 O-succinylbenzoate synthase [Salimicrobium flavidum]
MKLSEAVLHHIDLPMKRPFQTAHGYLESREVIIVELSDGEGRKGYGEIAAFSTPFYTEETVQTAWYIAKDFLLPRLDERGAPGELFSSVKGHPMAKAGIEQALFDLYAKREGKSLRAFVGGEREEVEAGGVISLSNEPEQELHILKQAGFQRAKVKVEQGKEREQLRALREIDPDFPLMIDGNGGYSSPEELTSLDDFNLLMIEQPFRSGDFHLHRNLQKSMKTPICLDESIRGMADAEQAIELGACQIINVKLSRVGGWSEALMIHEYAKSRNVPLWCGGMVETGIGKAHSLALASLPGFTLPGDLSGSDRYFEKDIIRKPLLMKNGRIPVPEGPGIGVEPDMEYIESIRVNRHSITY